MTTLATKDLTRGPIMRQLMSLAAPIMATSFIQMAYTLTDTAWVGRLGSREVAAIGTVGMIMWFCQTFTNLNKVGSEVTVSQAIGSQDSELARRYATHNVTMSLSISIVLGISLFLFAPAFIGIFQLEESIAALGIEYLRILSTSLPFFFLANTFTGIYNASGHTRVPFYISGMGLIFNMILDPVFILVFEWGTRGAAIATWLAQALVFGLFLYRLYKDKLLGGFKLLGVLKRKESWHIFRIGAPVSGFTLLHCFVNIYLMRMASSAGGHIGVMSFATGSQIEAITWNTTQGVSTALSTFVAQNYAAKCYKRVVKAIQNVLSIGGLFGIFTSLLFIFGGKHIFAIFVPEEEAFIAGGEYLFVLGFSQFFMLIEIVMQGIFYGIGRSVPPAINSVVFNYMRIPLAIFFVSIGLGLNGIWWGLTVGTVLKGISIFVWFMLIRKQVFGIKKHRLAV